MSFLVHLCDFMSESTQNQQFIKPPILKQPITVN